jgi:hypothetical protein
MKGKPIYFMEILVAYRKGRSMMKKDTWCVSTYTTPSDITRYDNKTMSRLNQELYNKTYKSQRNIVILTIKNRKEVGKTNTSE